MTQSARTFAQTGTPDADLIARFAAIVGEKHALLGHNDMAAYTTDTRGRYGQKAALVLRPKTVEDVSAILTLAHETGTSVIPQGGNTGLVGAGLPLTGDHGGLGGEVIVSLSRMNTVLDVDPLNNSMTVEAGVVLQAIQEAADAVDRLFPLSLGSQGSCQIGGNISSNAGGTGVIAYGNTRDLVLGLEAVLPSGELWNGLSRLRKDNTGYDLKNLFIGGEGTLGIVTKAVLKLFPKPKGREVAYVAVRSPQAALDLLNRAKDTAGQGLTAFELMASIGMEFTLAHAQSKIRRPIADQHPWYVLIEISSGSSQAAARATLETILGAAFEAGVVEDATLADSLEQQNQFWSLREEMSWAQKPEGASIKHDISVPISSVPDFIAKADAAVLKIVPDARIVNFGHLGDGNLHYNISQPVGWEADAFFAFEDAIHDSVYEIVWSAGGSMSAEHGIGQMKRERLAASKDPVSLAMMRRIKDALDPKGIMNPGKVI
ncbi:MAG: FAD-binding oxidoreductase [Pseudomonadota bacterium]